jgi:site-specific recombinase XerC
LVPYSARHTYGTYTMEKSDNAFAVSKSMGHTDLKSMEPYQHQELEPLRVAINQRNRRKKVVRFLVRFWKTHRRGKRTGNGKYLKD